MAQNGKTFWQLASVLGHMRIQLEFGRLTSLSVATAVKSGNRLYRPICSI